jgi:hypothetical protein
MFRWAEKYAKCAVECVKACVDREAKEVMDIDDEIAASEELLHRAEVCEKRCTELCERAGASFALSQGQSYMDRVAAALAYASARGYKQGLIALGIFMAALGAVFFIIGLVLGAPGLMIYSLAPLLIGITLTSYEAITNKNKDRGGDNAET